VTIKIQQNTLENTLCPLPWMQLMIGIEGEIHPCCRTLAFNNNVKSLIQNQSSTQENQNICELSLLRSNMLRGIKSSMCSECTLLDSKNISSLRTQSIKEYNDEFIQITREANANPLPLKSLDIRFSNTCNFKCRSCSPAVSTGWYDDLKLIDEYKSFKPLSKEFYKNKNLKIINIIKESYQSLRKIIFAGGEPLLHQEHYDTLEFLLKNQRDDIQLVYNTNLSILKFKTYNAVELWKKFKNVEIQISIDHIDHKFAYVREGTHSYQQILLNIKLIQQELKDSTIGIYCTISILNIFDIVEIIKKLILDGIITDKNKIIFNFLHSPQYYALDVLKNEEIKMIKFEILNFLSNDAKYYSVNIQNNINLELLKLLRVMPMKHDANLRQQLYANLNTLDQIRHQNANEHFPMYFFK
jgi:MoaA/NifB/PqqE/SkfB family radical SAM enzyme